MQTNLWKRGFWGGIIACFLVLFSMAPVRAEEQTEELCYSQCAAYKFVWQGDFCWDLFQEQCSMGSGNSIKETIKFLKSIYGVVKSGKNVDTVFKAWFVCKPLIEDCIAPQLRDCGDTCEADKLFYAPDLSVGHPYGSFYYRGVIYNDTEHTLTFKLVNNGRGYAWDIETEASWGHTRNRDGQVSGGGQLFKEVVPELIYAGARNGPPKTAGDYVVDFLIEESNFSQYLQGFKSDADNYNVPAVWYKTIPFTAPEGEMTKVFFNVDPSQMIPERSEANNNFVLEIDKLPTPASFEIENFSQKLTPGTLNNFFIEFDIKNNGEENGEATAKIFKGKGESGELVYNTSQTVQGLNKVNFGTFIKPDITESDTYCGKIKQYTLVIFDDKGKVETREFFLPLYSGAINGRVEDLFGKKVEGAKITLSSGETTTVNKYGSYHLKGLATLGKITVTATHPEFSQPESKEIELKIVDQNDPCSEGGLIFQGVNFILKDQDVNFTMTIKDTSGNPVKAGVIAYNQNWRFEEEVNGSGPLPGMQPGEYFFTLWAAGYKTIGQSVNAVPNEQNLEFVMEKMTGRSNDNSLAIHEPRLLWEFDRGEEIIAQMEATKNGKLFLIYTTRNKENSGKLYFLEALTGKQIKVVETVATKGQAQARLGTSYDGQTTALYVHTGTAGIARETKNVLKLFNNRGEEFGTTEFPGGGVSTCEVSPDGFYIYTGSLLNKGLHRYTRREIEGMDSDQKKGFASSAGFYFLHGNGVISSCKADFCAMTLAEKELVRYRGNKGHIIDSSFNDGIVAVGNNKKIFFFRNGEKAFEKDVNASGRTPSAAVSVGGQYLIYTFNEPKEHEAKFAIINSGGEEKTPHFQKNNQNEDVVFVHANDEGLFLATAQQKTLRYYQVGTYAMEFEGENSPTATPQPKTGSLSYWENGTFYQAGEIGFGELIAGKIYLADQSVELAIEGAGSLKILAGTLFSLTNGRQPVLLKGQMTANFASPTTIYAIKFDRNEMPLFQTKLESFLAGTLAENEYFVVKNVHTKFLVKNNGGQVTVAVEKGEVLVKGKEIEETVGEGKQVIINAENQVEKKNYLGKKAYFFAAVILTMLAGALLFIYRKTPAGKKILRGLGKTAKVIWGLTKKLARLFYSLLKKLWLKIGLAVFKKK